jgi:hypothetical protein
MVPCPWPQQYVLAGAGAAAFDKKPLTFLSYA